MVVQPPRNSSHEFSHQIPKLTSFFFEKFATLRSRQWPRGVEHQQAQMREEVSPPSSFLDLGVGFFRITSRNQSLRISQISQQKGNQFLPNNTSKVIYKSWKPNLKKKNVKFGVKFLFLNPSYYLSNFHVWSLAEKEKNRLTGRLSLAPMIICFTSAYSCDEPQKWFVVVGIQCSLKRP